MAGESKSDVQPHGRRLREAAEAGADDAGAHETQTRTEESDDVERRADDPEEESEETLHQRLVEEALRAGLSAREAGARVSADDMPQKPTVDELRRQRRRKRES